MKKMNRFWIVLMAIGLCITACGEKEQEIKESVPVLMDPMSTSDTENTIPVAWMDLYAGGFINVSVVPETVEMRFSMEGELVSVEVLAGEEVEEGQVLATLSQTNLLDTIDRLQEEMAHSESDYTLQLKQAELEVQIAEIQLQQLQAAYDAQEQRKAEEEAAAQESSRLQDSVNTEESGVIQAPEIMEESNTAQESVVQPEELKPQYPEITQVEIQLASLSKQEAELTYAQLLEEYNQEMAQREEELQAMLDQVGEDTLTAPFSGRVIEIYHAVGSYVTEDNVIMLIVNEDKKMLRGEPFYNTALKSVENLDVVINGETFDVTYVPYDDLEYTIETERREDAGEPPLPTWFTFECPEDMDFGEEGTVRAYDEYSENAMVIPSACVRSDELGKYVYKAEAGKRVKTYVILGVVTNNYTEIKEGLEEGDEVYGIE